MTIIWADHGGEVTETLLSEMLCLDHPHANRIRPASGDGGIDVRVPADNDEIDVYQIKAFHGSLDSSQRAQVKDSLDTLIANDTVQVHHWYLAVPVDPTPAQMQWFEDLTRNAPFECSWFGLAQCNGLAARHPEVERFHLGNGRPEVLEGIRQLRDLFDVTGGAADRHLLLRPGDTIDAVHRLADALNRDDPYYEYSVHAGPAQPAFDMEHPPPPSTSGFDAQAVKSQQLDDGTYVTYVVYPRYADIPASAAINIGFRFATPVDAAAETALRDFLEFGAPIDVAVEDLNLDLPGGLGETTLQGTVSIRALPIDGLEAEVMRFATLAPDGQILAEAVMDMESPTRGPFGGPNVRRVGRERSGVFEAELRMTDTRVSVNFRFLDYGGTSPAAVVGAVRFLASFDNAVDLRLADEFGPLPEVGFGPSAGSMITQKAKHLIEALALLQREKCGGLRVPPVDQPLDRDSLKHLAIAAALLRGEHSERRYTEWVIGVTDKAAFRAAIEAAGDNDQFRMQHTIPLTVFGQTFEITDVTLWFESATVDLTRLDETPAVAVFRPARTDRAIIFPAGSPHLTDDSTARDDQS